MGSGLSPANFPVVYVTPLPIIHCPLLLFLSVPSEVGSSYAPVVVFGPPTIRPRFPPPAQTVHSTKSADDNGVADHIVVVSLSPRGLIPPTELMPNGVSLADFVLC